MTRLRQLLGEHTARPFPTSVVGDMEYGGVDAPVTDSFIWSLAHAIDIGRMRRADIVKSLENHREKLVAALPCFPEDSRPYFEALVELADEAIRVGSA